MVSPVLTIHNLSKRFGAVCATRNLSFDLYAGEVHALIGPNGAGKTTAIAQLSGEIASDAGSIAFNGRDVTGLPVHSRARLGLSRSFQIPSVFESFTAEDNVAIAIQAHQGHSFRFWRRARRDRRLRDPAKQILQRLGLAQQATVRAADLSHGDRRQLEVAMALAGEPSVLLLDEPMAGLGPGGAVRMAELIGRLKGRLTMLLVEHDMDLVFSLADRISVLVYGELIATGTPEAIRSHPDVLHAYLGQ